MKKLRKIIFWIHLAAGLLFGAVLAVMASTGAILAFAPQILALADRDAITVIVPEGATYLPLSRIVTDAKKQTGHAPMAITVSAEPDHAVVLNFGRGTLLYANPYTAEILPTGSKSLRSFFRTVTMIHRSVGMGRAGMSATRTATLALALLCLTGFWLWWPRSWNARALRASLLPKALHACRARDWNWHNVAALWFLPFVVAMTWSGLAISIRSLGNWLNATAAKPALVMDDSQNARPVSIDRLLASALETVPSWKSATIRTRGPRRHGPESREPSAPVVEVEEHGFHLLPAEVRLHPTTGTVLSVRRAGDFSFREFLGKANLSIHRGVILGVFGQAMNGAACLALILVIYTGYSLSWRRFFSKKGRVSAVLSAGGDGK